MQVCEGFVSVMTDLGLRFQGKTGEVFDKFFACSLPDKAV